MIRHRRASHINQRNFVFVIAAAVFLVIVSFFIYQFKFFRSPQLVINAPAADVAIIGVKMEVAGKIDPDADLTVNGRPLYSGDEGYFRDIIFLSKGVNRLEFEAKNRYGRTSAITRYIISK